MKQKVSTESVRDRLLKSSVVTISELGHPAARITVEAAAKKSGQSTSTVASQAGGSHHFRLMIYEELIGQIDTVPGAQTWDELHSVLLGDGSAEEAFIDVCVARMAELGSNRTFALAIGAYDQSIVGELTDVIISHIDGLATGIRPLLEAAAAARGADIRGRFSTEPSRTILALGLMAGALAMRWEKTRLGRGDSVGARLLAKTMWRSEPDFDAPQPIEVKSYTEPRSRVLQRALEAAVELIVENDFTIAGGVSVNEACRNAGVGVSSFYKSFTSVENYKLEVLSESLRRSFEALGDGFFNHLSQDMFQALARNPNRYTELVWTYVDSVELSDKDLDIAIWSWMEFPDASDLVAKATQVNAYKRGDIYQLMVEGFGDSYLEGLDGRRLSALHLTIATATELHMRLFGPEERSAVCRIAHHLLLGTLLNSIEQKSERRRP